MDISLCMIVRDEEKYLECAIKSAGEVMGVSDVVVVDTGSADRTKEIAISCGARVFDFEWVDDFSAARNFAAEQAENDWIFYLDADEEIVEADMEKVDESMKFANFVGTASMLELSDNSVHGAARLYNRQIHTFHRNIHENLEPVSDEIETVRMRIPIRMNHRGYLPELWSEKDKYERNVRMLERELEKNPEDTFVLFNLGKCHFIFDRDLEKACECFERVLTLCDDVKLGYVYSTVECYGYALLNTGKYREALNLLEVYYPFFKSNPNFRFLAAHIYQNNAMFIEAVECYESCIGADMFDTKGITSFLSYYNIGVILECLEMIEDAIEMYRSCGDYEPAIARLKKLIG